MDLFRRTPPPRVVKTFGRDSLLILANPLLSALQATLGLRIGLHSEAELLQKMEDDAQAMEKRGYRVLSADRYDLPVIAAPGRSASYYKVTYERSERGGG